MYFKLQYQYWTWKGFIVPSLLQIRSQLLKGLTNVSGKCVPTCSPYFCCSSACFPIWSCLGKTRVRSQKYAVTHNHSLTPTLPLFCTTHMCNWSKIVDLHLDKLFPVLLNLSQHGGRLRVLQSPAGLFVIIHHLQNNKQLSSSIFFLAINVLLLTVV